MPILYILLLATTLFAEEKSVITIYSDGYAVVSETRTLNLTAGDNVVTIGDLPKNILGESFRIGGNDVSARQFTFLGPRETDYTFEGFLDDMPARRLPSE